MTETFAGGRVNHAYKYGFEILEGWKVVIPEGWNVVADNFQLRIDGDGVTHERVAASVGRIDSEGLREEPRTRSAVLGKLPGYRLSKFQECLPQRYALDVVATSLFSMPNIRRRRS